MIYYADMQMLNPLGARERTIEEFMALAVQTGWTIVKVHRPAGSGVQQIECNCA